MIPQLVQPDSAKKSSDVLPFAPFINQEQVKKTLAKQNSDSAKTTVKRKQKAKTDTVTVQAKKDTATNRVFAKQQLFLSADTSKKDTSSLTTDSTALSVQPQPEFRFDDDPVTSGNVVSEIPYQSSESYFSKNLLRPNATNATTYSPFTPDWFTVILIIMLVCLTGIRVLYRKTFKSLFISFGSLAATQQLVRDENVLVQRATVLLNIIFYGIAALLFYQVSIFYEWESPLLSRGIFRFFIFAIFVAAFYSIKMIAIKFLGGLFKIDRPASVYLFSIFLINNVLGMVLLPLVALVSYVNFQQQGLAFNICIGVVVCALLYTMARALIIGFPLHRFSLYYLIIYFCALEISPIALLVKAAKNF